jgi:hypothetical protein
MCCLVTALLLLGPRIALVIWWFMNPARFNLAFNTRAWPIQLPVLPYWIWPLLGGIFVPWTTLAYLYVFPGGINGLDWLWLGVGFVIDLGALTGGYRHRDRFRR